jgi:predicted nucleotidyltransferase
MTNERNQFGLTVREMLILKSVFAKYPSVKSIIIFGSRAKGTFTTGSDIDLAIMDKLDSDETLPNIKNDFEDSSLPYFIDLVCYPFLTDSDFKKHIDRVGVPLF